MEKFIEHTSVHLKDIYPFLFSFQIVSKNEISIKYLKSLMLMVINVNNVNKMTSQ